MQDRELFQYPKFGLFIHWGVYSIMGVGGDEEIDEWIMNCMEITIDTSERLPGSSITITSKYHNGFAMFHGYSTTGQT